MNIVAISFLLKGFLIGFSIAMAVGPISLLCIQNSLAKGFLQGFATGLGAAVADAVYGTAAGFGIVTITSLLLSYKTLLQIVGGLFLCYLGVTMFRTKKTEERKEMVYNKFWPIFSTTFFLTMTNPMTIVSFIAIYAGLGIRAGENNMLSACFLTAGIFLGSAVWYLFLSAFFSLLKSKFTTARLLWLNRISGSIILFFGIASFLTIQ